MIELKGEIGDLKVELVETGVDVGPAIYLARAFGTDVDTVVKFFIFILIFVFDPLAVLLLISANQSYRKELEINPPEEKGLPVNVGKTIRSATTHKGVKKVTKERDGVKIHFFEEDDGKG